MNTIDCLPHTPRLVGRRLSSSLEPRATCWAGAAEASRSLVKGLTPRPPDLSPSLRVSLPRHTSRSSPMGSATHRRVPFVLARRWLWPPRSPAMHSWNRERRLRPMAPPMHTYAHKGHPGLGCRGSLRSAASLSVSLSVSLPALEPLLTASGLTQRGRSPSPPAP